MRLWVIAAGLLAMAGCVTPIYHYRVGVVVPDTTEGRACARECMALVGTCTYYRQGDTQVVVTMGRRSQQHGCPGLITDCLMTCDGAREDPANPPRMVLVDGQGREIREPSPDRWDDRDYWDDDEEE